MLKNNLISKTTPLLIGLLALIACNTTTNGENPIKSSAVTQLKVKWAEKTLLGIAPWSNIQSISWKSDGTKIAVSDFSRRTFITAPEVNTGISNISNLGYSSTWEKNGGRIATYGDSEVIIADTVTGNTFTLPYANWLAQPDPIEWSPDGLFIIGTIPVYSSQNQLVIWNVSTRQVIQNFGSQSNTFALSWSSVGNKILVVGSGRGVYDANTFEKIFEFPENESPTAGSFSPNGNYYAVSYYQYTQIGGQTYRIAIHNATDGTIIKSIPLSKLPTTLKWNPSGTQIGGGYDDGTSSIWNVSTGNIVQELPIQNNRIVSLKWHPSGSPIAVASGQNLTFYNALTGEEEGQIAPTVTTDPNQRTNNVYALAYNPNGTELLEVGRDATNVIRKSSDGKRITKFSSHSDSVYGVAYNPEGSKFITASADGTAVILDQASNNPIGTLSGHAYTVRGVAWSNMGTRIATASWDSTAKLWNPETSQEIATIQHTDFVNAVAFNPASSQVATGSSDRTLKISSSTDGTLIRSIDTPAAILSLAWNSSGTQIAIGATDKNIYVYNAATGALLKTLTGHIGAVRAVLWSKDNSAIISGADDGNLKLWDVSTSAEISNQKPASGYAIFTLALSPDGNTVATGTANGKTVAYTIQ
jgi:WD40 repeat protein